MSIKNKKFSTIEEFIQCAKILAEQFLELGWITEADMQEPANEEYRKYFEGEGLYILNNESDHIEILFNPKTDVGFEWNNIEYNLVPMPRTAAELVCWECSEVPANTDPAFDPKNSLGLYNCPECDRSYENGAFI